ncbi:hypothetical protein GCM10009830_38200 [Glycomyces endophyticus]|uniref:Uncharacterized protein n=1 Tax=Glycomyces endophyticus TaxID=480996 RepID=A0ABN2HFC0_9ACTN
MSGLLTTRPSRISEGPAIEFQDSACQFAQKCAGRPPQTARHSPRFGFPAAPAAMVWNPVDSRISVTLRICNITHRLSSVKQKQRLRQIFFRVACHARPRSTRRVAGATGPFGWGPWGGA